MTPTADTPTTDTGPKFIVKSGAGYFLLWVAGDSLAKFSSDPAEAARLSSDEADKAILKFERLGFNAKKVQV